MTKAWFKLLWLPVIITLVLLALKLTGLLLVSYIWVFLPITFTLASLYLVFLAGVGTVIGMSTIVNK